MWNEKYQRLVLRDVELTTYMILEKATERSARSTGNAEVGRLSMGGQWHLTGIAAGRRASEKKNWKCRGVDGKNVVIKVRLGGKGIYR
jgi:hypothetical protein